VQFGAGFNLLLTVLLLNMIGSLRRSTSGNLSSALPNPAHRAKNWQLTCWFVSRLRAHRARRVGASRHRSSARSAAHTPCMRTTRVPRDACVHMCAHTSAIARAADASARAKSAVLQAKAIR